MNITPPAERSVRELRRDLADVLNETAVRGQITYITSRGRRVAAIVPVPVAEAAEREDDGTARSEAS
jgi:prevent-host-death family protein